MERSFHFDVGKCSCATNNIEAMYRCTDVSMYRCTMYLVMTESSG